MSTRYKNIGRTKYQSRFQDRIIWIMAKLFLRDIHARKRNFIGRVVKLPIRLTLRREKGDGGEKCIKVFPIPTTQEPRDDSHYLENSFHPFIARVAELFFTRFRVRAPSHERYKRPNLAASRASHSEINRNENSNGTSSPSISRFRIASMVGALWFFRRKRETQIFVPSRRTDFSQVLFLHRFFVSRDIYHGKSNNFVPALSPIVPASETASSAKQRFQSVHVPPYLFQV